MSAAILRRLGLALVAVSLPAALGAGCGDDDVGPPGPKPNDGGVLDAIAPEPFKATVRRTSAGVPHVKADDFGGLGYGYGYVFAEDNLCIFEEELLTVRGQRAKYFGDVPYDLGNSDSKSNVGSDAVYQMLATKDVVDKAQAMLDPETRALVRGYAAGISRYVRELKAGKHEGRHASCRNEPWAREVTEEDMYLRVYKLAVLASTGALLDNIWTAQPPSANQAPEAPRSADPAKAKEEFRKGLESLAPKFVALREGQLGSNMYAFGSELTGGGGIQFGNPHFPWYGGERLYQVHLTVPGKMDIQGVSLYGVPSVLIGFTENFAWSHTVSSAFRFTPYALTLKPGDPLTYIQDGAEKKITAVDLTIEVKGADGQVTPRNVRLYRSEYGPMLNLGSAGFGWSTDTAFTFRDANADNFRFIKQYTRWNQAKSLEEFVKIHEEEVASPWVNTTATDKSGNVYYGDLSVVPNVSDEHAKSCEFKDLSALLSSNLPGLPLLDGSKKACDWKVDEAASQPGTMPASQLPKIQRKDWVLNCNDSYWLTNTRAPITGFAKIVGQEQYRQTLRSRLCHQQVLDRVSGADGLPGTNMTEDLLKQIVLGSRVYTAEKFKTPIVDAVCTQASIQLTKDPIDGSAVNPPVDVPIGAACDARKAWQNRDEIDSKGSIVWDELWFRVLKLNGSGAVTYNQPFDPANPVDTPNNLDVSSPDIAQAFAAAVRAVTAAGFAVDAPRSAVSWVAGKGGPADRIPIFGGFDRNGAFTVAETSNVEPRIQPDVGYGPIRRGNSYIQLVSFGAAGMQASTFVTYSLSTDPASPHYDDYTRLYSQKQWVKAAFTEAEIAADTKVTLELQQ